MHPVHQLSQQIVFVLSGGVLLFTSLGLLWACWVAVQGLRGRLGPDQEAHWDADCECCAAGCGDTDEENACVICLH